MRITLPTSFGIAGVTAAAIAVSVLAPSQAGAATTVKAKDTSASVESQLFADAKSSILNMATKSNVDDTQVLENGRFRYVGTTCYRCELGPAVAAAALYRRTGDVSMKNIATTVFDAAIKDQQRADGSFSVGVPGDGLGNSIQTIFFTQHLGAALTYFGPTLDATRRATYTKALTRAADWVASSGNMEWYANGNINLAITVGQGMAWKATGLAKYQVNYEKSMKFTLTPTGRWADMGLKFAKKGKLALGRDSAAYLAEKGEGGTGFDADYTQFQADIASQGYQVIGDQRLLTLLNQLNNQLLTKTNTANWALEVAGGTRHPNTKGYDQYQSPALYLAATNGRPDLTTIALSQVKNNLTIMKVSSIFAYPGMYQAWGSRFAVDIFAIA